ncbi:hypothetical protein TTHT_1008 [Thermotomaculum hydrothermale]|uniref:RloB-like protein n=1 Tax=Thermotomaculum hydrothermale TaxID=981385 RepID=A0A7R6PZF0_9BACT|nr:RloB family protein [Thermotomaculum hydrothermale]BBB32548.1 hypothetical protein TTHT_1008 [Thermotomaculum hydrothermale]
MRKKGRANRRNKKRQEKKLLVIYVDGETEVWYFNLVKKQLVNEKVFLKLMPEIAKSGTPEEKLVELNKFIKKYQRELEQAYLLLDFDTIRKESDWYQKIFDIRKKKRKRIKGEILNEKIRIIVNNPCLEYWFLLHFSNTKRFFENCDSVIQALSKEVKNNWEIENGYKKHEKEFKNFCNRLYREGLFKVLKEPIKRAENIGFLNGLEDIDKSVAEIFVIFKHINKLRR